MAVLSVIVKLQKDRRDDIKQIAASLRDRGMNVQEELQLLGRITGTADEADISSLEAVPGVAKIKPERTFKTQ